MDCILKRDFAMSAHPLFNQASALDSPLDYAVSVRDRAILQEVETAVRSRNVALAFQPVVQARATDRVAFHEGLIRILDDRGTPLPAAQFMPVAETRELGRRIDCLALELGLETLARVPDVRLSVNMSARSIGYPRWTETLRRGLEDDPRIAERLILEITEASAMVIPDVVSVFMADMHRRGVSFALDDFGAGYTAFRYLKDFHFDLVKIDGQFIRGIDGDPDNQVLAQALVAIARQFDMFTVAEAVETAGEAAFLAQAGVDCLQGYHFGRPEVGPDWATTPVDRVKARTA